MGFSVFRAGARQKKRAVCRGSKLSRQRVVRLATLGVAVAGMLGASFYAWQSGLVVTTARLIKAEVVQAGVQAGFQVDDILIKGRSHVSQRAIMAALDVRRGMPIFSVDIAAAQKRLSDLSWIDQARVRRILPGTLVVELREKQPAALWQHRKKLHLIDTGGAVLETDDLAAFKDLLLVVGDKADQNFPALAGLLAATPDIAAQVSSAVYVGRRRWDLYFNSGLIVKLPEDDPALALARLAKAQDNHDILSKPVRNIDLRLPDRLVVAERDHKDNRI